MDEKDDLKKLQEEFGEDVSDEQYLDVPSEDDDNDDIDEDDIEIIAVDECGVKSEECEEVVDELAIARNDLGEARDEYVRLYAEFENYRKRMNKDKEELHKYANESILLELLPTIDNLEIALKHADDEVEKESFVEGVEMTLRELYRTLEKFNVKVIEVEGKDFDPEFHHAVAHIEQDDMDENKVVAELRRGFMYHDKVIRATMVSVSKRPNEETSE